MPQGVLCHTTLGFLCHMTPITTSKTRYTWNMLGLQCRTSTFSRRRCHATDARNGCFDCFLQDQGALAVNSVAKTEPPPAPHKRRLLVPSDVTVTSDVTVFVRADWGDCWCPAAGCSGCCAHFYGSKRLESTECRS